MRETATKATSHANEPRHLAPEALLPAPAPLPLRFGRIRALAFAATLPVASRPSAVGAATPMTLLRVASEDELAFEALRTELRARAGYPVTQPN